MRVLDRDRVLRPSRGESRLTLKIRIGGPDAQRAAPRGLEMLSGYNHSMKDEVLHGLLAARTLFDIARLHCAIRDRYIASAGLIVLQDALELVFYSCLLELGADEHKSIEQFTFDQLIGELRQWNMPILKSGTLKA